MSLVSSQTTPSSLLSSTSANNVDKPSHDDTEAALSSLLGAFTKNEHTSEDRGPTEYSHSGLPTPYPHAFTKAESEEATADHASATQYTPRQDVYSKSATPTSEYGVCPASARSTSAAPERQYHTSSNHSGSSGGMAQPTSPSMPQDGRNHQNTQNKSDQDVPIDPSIAASSPTYPQHGGQPQYSPYPPQQEMQHGYPQHPQGPMYAQPRPDWAGYGGHPQQGMPGYPVSGAHTPTSAAPAGARPGQVGVAYPYHHQVHFLSTRDCMHCYPLHPLSRRKARLRMLSGMVRIATRQNALG
jgi:hypothetical protein